MFEDKIHDRIQKGVETIVDVSKKTFQYRISKWRSTYITSYCKLRMNKAIDQMVWQFFFFLRRWTSGHGWTWKHVNSARDYTLSYEIY